MHGIQWECAEWTVHLMIQCDWKTGMFITECSEQHYAIRATHHCIACLLISIRIRFNVSGADSIHHMYLLLDIRIDFGHNYHLSIIIFAHLSLWTSDSSMVAKCSCAIHKSKLISALAKPISPSLLSIQYHFKTFHCLLVATSWVPCMTNSAFQSK